MLIAGRVIVDCGFTSQEVLALLEIRVKWNQGYPTGRAHSEPRMPELRPGLIYAAPLGPENAQQLPKAQT